MTKQVKVIDAEEWDKLISFIRNQLKTIVDMPNVTTITLDDDIEKRVEDLFSITDGFFKSIDKEAVIKFATEQQIISEMKMKEEKRMQFENGVKQAMSIAVNVCNCEEVVRLQVYEQLKIK